MFRSNRTIDVADACVEALLRYRLRTALSIVGIALGIAAVVSMVSVSQGARAEALRQVSLLGLKNVVVRYRSPSLRELERQHSFGLTLGDADRIAGLRSAASLVSPLRERSIIAIGPRAREDATAVAVASSYFDILGLVTTRGRPLSAIDDASVARVCVIGAELGMAMFGHDEPIGQSLNIDGVPYVVVGVLADRRIEARQIGSISPRSFQRAAIVPLSAFVAHDATVDRWLKVDEIWVQAAGGADPAAVGAAVDRALLSARPYGADYDLIVPRELLNQQVRLRRTFDVVVGAIAVVTLLVGGIGVMNVMLTSVFERTSEIGLRRAVGATRAAIGFQFLLEAVAISGAGGVTGLVLGLATTLAISALGEWPTVISFTSVIAATVVAVGVGLLSGIYPARRAAYLDPIEAVRYE
jgi:putative ABC transport system permease protein